MKDSKKKERNTEEMVIDTLFTFVFSQQIAILLKIDFKISPVNLKHFIDHYIKILPSLDDKIKNNWENSIWSSPQSIKDLIPELFEKNLKSIKKREQVELLKEMNDEIREWINSICNLSPLLPDFSKCNFSEVAVASVWVTVSFSFKCLASKWDNINNV